MLLKIINSFFYLLVILLLILQHTLEMHYQFAVNFVIINQR